MSTQTFYELLNDEKKSKQYARATEIRADNMAGEILEISDNIGGDAVLDPTTNKLTIDHAVVQRDRLRVDARKWLLAKMHPKKYGDKIDMTSDNKAVQFLPPINLIIRESTESGD